MVPFVECVLVKTTVPSSVVKLGSLYIAVIMLHRVTISWGNWVKDECYTLRQNILTIHIKVFVV